jgi:hypothetical protein
MSVFKGSKNFYEFEMSDTLVSNIINWLRYGFLEMGAFTNVRFSLPNSGYTNLKAAYDERYGGIGKIYEGIGPSWVWESGVSPIGTNQTPFQVSGIYVNNTFYPTSTSGTHSYTVDYERGRIVFNNALSSTSTVKCEYTIRDIGVFNIDSSNFKSLVDNYLDNFDNMDENPGSGLASILKENRIWLPSVFVDIQDRTNEGLQLGGGEISTFAMFYHVFADKPFENKRIMDTISNQDFKTLHLYDINTAPHKLNRDGSIPSGILPYTSLATRESPYFLTFAYIASSRANKTLDVSDVFRSQITQSVEVSRYLSTY